MRVLTFCFGDYQTNTYFCFDESGACAVIDPGMDGEAVVNKLRERGLTPSHILLTHGHFDHILGVKAVQSATGAKVCIHTADAPLLSDPGRNAAVYFYRGQTESYPSLHGDILLHDGDRIDCGSFSFTVLHTPGHTAGSVCFSCGDTLFCGDTVFAYGYGRTDLAGGDAGALADSLERLAAIPENMKLCPGHGNSAHLDNCRSQIKYYARMLRMEG
ncbi:MAG: MBL fold metallo-hydrolase [Clostridia bacterium]|nr:MBL fold metallo-hydrolase [Clostridia bacterium]